MPKLTITVNRRIYKRLKEIAQESGYKSPEALVKWLLRYNYSSDFGYKGYNG